MRTRLFCIILMMGWLPGCAPLRSVEGPMNSVTDSAGCRVKPRTLVVFLPGVYDVPQDFIDQGFVRALRERDFHADIQLVDAHRGYYSERQILQRIDDEIVKPARANGYLHIWFVGISLGGYGTLLYARHQPGAVDGFLILAPYMGSAATALEIEDQGGLAAWSSPPRGNADVELWRWLQGYANKPTDRPTAYLGFGRADRFAQPNGVFAQVLPARQVFTVDGGHDWSTWRQLWAQFLDAAPWPRIDRSDNACASRPG
jgi:hypothetical protein